MIFLSRHLEPQTNKLPNRAPIGKINHRIGKLTTKSNHRSKILFLCTWGEDLIIPRWAIFHANANDLSRLCFWTRYIFWNAFQPAPILVKYPPLKSVGQNLPSTGDSWSYQIQGFHLARLE